MMWAFGIAAGAVILAAFVYSERRYKTGFSAGYNAAKLEQAEKEKTENEKLDKIIGYNNGLERDILLDRLYDGQKQQ